MNEERRDGVRQAIAAAQEHLEKGEPLLAYNALQVALERRPHHKRLRQLYALALARSGDVKRANAFLGALAREGLDDAETLGLLARTHKDLALDSADPLRRAEHLEAGFALYERAYREAGRQGLADAAWYTGINAATMALLRQDLARARQLASEVRDICLGASGRAEGAAYWREATLGEAALLLGDAAAAAAHYLRAATLAKGRYGELSSTRRQARLVLASFPDAAPAVLEALAIPPVLVFTGCMIDRTVLDGPRFPPQLEPAVRRAVREKLERLRPLAAYGSAACGADIVCLEVARELGAETHVILPFSAAEFRAASVDFAGGGWGARFERALAAADSVTVTSDHYTRDSAATFEYANLVLTGMARLRARTLDAPLEALAVWDRTDPGGSGGSASLVRFWRAHGMRPQHVHLDSLRDGRAAAERLRPPRGQRPDRAGRHEIRAMLFADAVGYSRLSEDQIPAYIDGFLGAVAQLCRRTSHRYEHVETAGDGLYMVFRKATDAGRFALELRDTASQLDREAWGLPADLGLRVALHCGPVHCARDPITGLPLYTGPHTSRAARIEPVTPPGQVYASSAFAAVLAASGDAFSLSYVGRVPLAKDYGFLGLYHVRGAHAASMAR